MQSGLLFSTGSGELGSKELLAFNSMEKSFLSISMEKRHLHHGLFNCHCGKRASIKTAWMDKNPGRRFAACSMPKGECCGFWEWYDPPMCDRAVTIIPGLLHRIDGLECELEKMAMKVKKCESKSSRLEAKLKNAETQHRKKMVVVYCVVVCVLIACFLANGLRTSRLKMCIGESGKWVAKLQE